MERIVAQHFGLQPEQVMLTNGVDEAIHLMCCAFLEAGRRSSDLHAYVLHVRRDTRMMTPRC